MKYSNCWPRSRPELHDLVLSLDRWTEACQRPLGLSYNRRFAPVVTAEHPGSRGCRPTEPLRVSGAALSGIVRSLLAAGLAKDLSPSPRLRPRPQPAHRPGGLGAPGPPLGPARLRAGRQLGRAVHDRVRAAEATFAAGPETTGGVRFMTTVSLATAAAIVLGLAHLAILPALHIVPSEYGVVHHAVSDYGVGPARGLEAALPWTSALFWAALAAALLSPLEAAGGVDADREREGPPGPGRLGRVLKVVSGEGVVAGVLVLTVGGLPG